MLATVVVSSKDERRSYQRPENEMKKTKTQKERGGCVLVTVTVTVTVAVTVTVVFAFAISPARGLLCCRFLAESPLE